ncbi:Uncharacterized protein FWK35_00025315 [Aphis craccivora]|uniref:Uncharacterized protein n=1 Tax=Aphis craccivora TaxID=307492 RepID=A0A6G0VLV4_APHCR|nr:Uncharacterized protein FWK35_00025315 [Aphis craccivora]
MDLIDQKDKFEMFSFTQIPNIIYLWKKAELSLKVTITDQAKDQELKNNLSEVVQTIFTRFMSDPKRKIFKYTCVMKHIYTSLTFILFMYTPYYYNLSHNSEYIGFVATVSNGVNRHVIKLFHINRIT